MADEKPKAEAQAAEPKKRQRKKRSWPTNCAQTNKRVRRKDWFYRNGKYFANKKAFKLYLEQEAEKARKASEEAAAKAQAAATQPAAGAPDTSQAA